MPSTAVLKNVAWTIAAIAVIARVEKARMLVFGNA